MELQPVRTAVWAAAGEARGTGRAKELGTLHPRPHSHHSGGQSIQATLSTADPLPVTLASHEERLVQVLAVLLVIQLPADVPWRSSAWASAAHRENLDEVPGS